MPIEREVPVWAAELTLLGSVPVSFVLGWPSVREVGGTPLGVAARFLAAAQSQWFSRGEVLPLIGAFPAVQVEVESLRVDVPEKRGAWPDIHLDLHVLVAEPSDPQATPASFAWVPALMVSAVAPDRAALREALRRRVLAELGFQQLLTDGAALFALQAPTDLQVLCQTHTVTLHTFREVRELARANEAALLPRLARRLDPWPQVGPHLAPDGGAIGMEPELDAVTRAAEGRFGRSVVLVGPSGVGKSELVLALARRDRLGQPVFETTAARLIRGLTGPGGWQASLLRLLAELEQSGHWLYVRQLTELFEVGRYIGNRVSIGEFLRTALHAGTLRLISECTPEEKSMIDARYPGWLTGVVVVPVAEPGGSEPGTASGDRLRRIVRTWADHRAPTGVEITDDAVDEAIRLGRRFSPYAGFPGRPLRTLAAAAHALLARHHLDHHPSDAEEDSPSPSPSGAAWTLTLDRSGVIQRFTEESGIPRWLVDPEITVPHAELHAWFTSRVFGQPEAVAAAVDTITTIKADVGRSGRPIVSLLLVGPTGVGKTETARALASYLFGDAERLTRFDMSEYSDPGAVLRLVGYSDSEGTVEGRLTGAVRRQPFGVLLFDEVEKAHPGFLDLLLQVLGEGRLSDASGQVADFCATVVVLTSNIGATAALRPPTGFTPSNQGLSEQLRRAVLSWLRPELYNRIDRLLSYAPLGPDSILSVLDRELRALARRPGLARHRLEVPAPIRAELAEAGFQPAFGARPLQRVLQDALVTPLAAALNGWRRPEAPTFILEPGPTPIAAGGTLRVRLLADPKPTPPLGPAAPFEAARATRRLARALHDGPAASRLRNAARAHATAQRRRRRGPSPHAPFPHADVLQEAERLLGRASDLEVAAGQAFLDPRAPELADDAGLGDALDRLAQRLVSAAELAGNTLVFGVWGVQAERRDGVVTRVIEAAHQLGFVTELLDVWLEEPVPPAGHDRVRLVPPELPPRGLSRVLGAEIRIEGPAAALLFEGLDGVWSWYERNKVVASVRTLAVPGGREQMAQRRPADLERLHSYRAHQDRVSVHEGEVTDHWLDSGDLPLAAWEEAWPLGVRARFFQNVRAAATA